MLHRTAAYTIFVVLILSTAARAGDFTFVDDGERLTVADRGRLLVEYVYKFPAELTEPNQDSPGPTHYLHPVVGLSGETVTGDSASIWEGTPGIHWGWSRLGIAGQLINVESGQGAHREFERWLGVEDGDDEGVFALQSAWVTESDGRAQVMENMTVTVYPLDGSRRYLDIGVLIRNVSDAKLRLEGSLPGTGLTVVLDAALSDLAFSAASGWKHPGDAPYLSPWTVCTYRDARRSTRSGVAILQDSRNPAFSSANWSIGEGSRVTVGAPGEFKMDLRSGDFLEFRYRIILFRTVGGGPNMTAEFSKFMGNPLISN